MNAKATLLAREEKPKKRKRQEDVQQDRGGRWLGLENNARTGAPSPPNREVHKLHPVDYPNKPSFDAN